MTDGDGSGPALVRLLRDEGRRVLATLVRHTGDLQLAEDAVQDALVRALDTWPRTGVPPQPRAWLTVTARNRAVDLVRRESARTGKEAESVSLLGPPADEPSVVGLLALVLLQDSRRPARFDAAGRPVPSPTRTGGGGDGT